MRAVHACLLLAPVALFACGVGVMPNSLPHPLAGALAPEFRGVAISDREVGLPGSVRTKVTVIDFWASWCTGCQQTLSALDELWRDKKSDGVMVIGISVDQSGDDALALVHHLHASFPIVLDPGMQIAGPYGVANVPITFVVDGHGTVRWVGRDPRQTRRAVEIVLAEQ